MIASLDYRQTFPFNTIFVPPVRLEAGNLLFQPQGSLRLSTGLTGRLVYDFSLLAEGPDEFVLEFARQWGVLGICRHGKTLQHQAPMCLPRRVGHEFVESVQYWRRRAARVRSILNVKAALDRNQVGERGDWKRIWPGRRPTDCEGAAEILALVASFLLSEANVQPMLHRAAGKFAITFIGGNLRRLLEARAEAEANQNGGIGEWLSNSGSLFAQIAIRTALAIQNRPGWAVCSDPDCRRLYRPLRHVREDRRNFCPDCGDRASWRMSKRRKAAERSR